MRIDDDGIGVRGVTRPGIGMTSMRERAEELGGTVGIARGRPAGTCVTATLPVVGPESVAAAPQPIIDAHVPRDHTAAADGSA